MTSNTPDRPDAPAADALLRSQIETVIGSWYGIALPNEAAHRFISGLAATAPQFAAFRGRLTFEDEPAGFEAALQATKEPT